jgi:glycosyltransferase involved in cell wall biosynthesis
MPVLMSDSRNHPLDFSSMMQPQYLADFSLALINRTGAYYVCRDVVEELPHFFRAVRYWRLLLKKEPPTLARKLLGRAMLLELSRLKFTERLPRGPRWANTPTLFFDPLYVLRSRLRAQDIVLCHDIGPVSHIELFDRATTLLYLDAYERIAAARPGIVFVSEASRSAFVNRFGDDYRFLKVIPLYVRSDLTVGEEHAPPGLREPFFLTVGGLEKRKNHCRIIAAFEASGLRREGYSYVFCGPRGNSARTVEILAQKTPGVHAFGYLNDAELRWLYRRAIGFVLPSLLEGFGLPPLEAAQYGLLSVVSCEGAQREAVGEAGILVDPTSIDSIAEGMRRVARMSETERTQKLTLLRKQARVLSRDRYLARWAELLAANA